MKKLIFLLPVFLSIQLFSNIALPQAYISEVYIDSLDQWTIELGFYYSLDEIDSMIIETSSGSSVITNITLITGPGYPGFDSLAIITINDLNQALSINRNLDFITIITYSLGTNSINMVEIGGYNNSYLPVAGPNQSISYLIFQAPQSMGYTSTFAIDNSPTIGTGNDTTGAMLTFEGTFYNVQNNTLTEGFFTLPLYNYSFDINPDGTFKNRIPSRCYDFGMLRVYYPSTPFNLDTTYYINPFSFCSYPDSVISQDIIATSVLSANSIETNDYKIVSYPNPFNTEITFFYELPAITNSGNITICDLNGKIVFNQPVINNFGKLVWQPGNSASKGFYNYFFTIDGQIIKQGKIVKL